MAKISPNSQRAIGPDFIRLIAKIAMLPTAIFNALILALITVQVAA